MEMFLKQALGSVVVLGAIAARAHGDVVYDNFGPSNTYQIGLGWAVGGPSSGPLFKSAMAFTLDHSYVLTQAEFGIAREFGGVSTVTVTVHADQAGVPGAALEQVSITTILGPAGIQQLPVPVTFAGTTALVAGEQYWISLSASLGNNISWHWNNTGDQGFRAFTLNEGPWNVGIATLGAFRLQGELVPAPGALGLVLMSVCAARRRRRVNVGSER